jgi:hypothetical protein
MKKTAKTTIETVVVESVATVKGRKVNPDSARQKRLAKQGTGDVKRGRPVSGTSARQARIAELTAKRESGELKKGRPVNGDSARQIRLAKRASGEVKKGRPAKAKVEVVIEKGVKMKRGQSIVKIEQNDLVTLERG